jgi:hypothetical protein
MAERVKRLGGEFGLVSAPGQGTTVQVDIQLEPALEPPRTVIPDEFESSQFFHEETRQNSHPDC